MTREDTAHARTADPSAGSGWAGAVPNLEARTVVGVFTDAGAVERAYNDLLSMGFTGEEISVVRQGEPAPQMSAEDTKAGTGIAAGATAGAVLGGIAGLAALAIPGVGPLIAAGPIGVLLGGALAGGALGALAGSFAGLGIPKEHAEEYEAAVRRGGTVLTVKTADADKAERVSDLLHRYGAERVTDYQPAM